MRLALLAAALLLPLAPATAAADGAAVASPAASTAASEAGDAPPARRTVSGWLPYWDQENAYLHALRHADQLHTVSPFWYEAKADGTVADHPGAGDRPIVDGLHRAGIKVVPTVMETMPKDALAALVTDPARRAAHVNALLATAAKGDYDGLDLDYETLATTGDATYAAVRDGYAALVTELCARLRARAKSCLVTVMPKTAATGRVWDYAALGKAADRVRIMGYNLHWANGAPGPLASTAWYEEVLRTATALIPAERLELGLPAYGWDWTVRADGTRAGRAAHVTWKEAESLRRAKRAPYRLDPESGTPYFLYADGTDTHHVWYQDARGVSGHLPVLRRHGVTHTALWALGFEDPALWPVLAQGAAAGPAA
ncbi:glycosyl hydrolase family 18 protein [Streptomyces showdoensis]|uniref:glycosyl hydrolase family 18 protein n=1 Tax=Streptomyces showdoensis TaxID=68268 RepID=UPI000F500D41|nr:glycosyl hydrolase family 18 protein [Streptomyces showdoensis]